MDYKGISETTTEKVDISLVISSESLPNKKMDKKLAQEIKQVKERLKRIKDYVSSWYHSEMMKQLIREHVKPIKPPLKKTNITLKNPNFRIAARLWDYIRVYDTEPKENAKENKVLEDSIDLLKGFLDHSFFIDYSVLSSMNSKKLVQKKQMTDYVLLILTEEVQKMVDLLIRSGISISEEDLLALIAKEIRNNKKTKVIGRKKKKKKFQTAMDDYLERIQKNL